MATGFELIRFPNGSCSLRLNQPGSEAMHSSIGPWAEANAIYVEQSAMVARLRSDIAEPLVLYDIGMGIAANALAAIMARRELSGSMRPLHIVSFENDVSALEMALQCGDDFPFLNTHREFVRELLRTGAVEDHDASIRWELLRGDLRVKMSAAPQVEIVFYDFYSPAVCPELWTIELFSKLRAKCQENALLITYVAATSARAAMLLAGFAVGVGCSTEAKRETTLASTTLGLLAAPLGKGWLSKLERSSRPWPVDLVPSERDKALEDIKRLSQYLAPGAAP